MSRRKIHLHNIYTTLCGPHPNWGKAIQKPSSYKCMFLCLWSGWHTAFKVKLFLIYKCCIFNNSQKVDGCWSGYVMSLVALNFSTSKVSLQTLDEPICISRVSNGSKRLLNLLGLHYVCVCVQRPNETMKWSCWLCSLTKFQLICDLCPQIRLIKQTPCDCLISVWFICFFSSDLCLYS